MASRLDWVWKIIPQDWHRHYCSGKHHCLWRVRALPKKKRGCQKGHLCISWKASAAKETDSKLLGKGSQKNPSAELIPDSHFPSSATVCEGDGDAAHAMLLAFVAMVIQKFISGQRFTSSLFTFHRCLCFLLLIFLISHSPHSHGLPVHTIK